MAKGSVYSSERAILRDARSGLRIFRLTHYPTISMCLYFEQCSFTEDEQYVVLFSQRTAGRDAPWDLMRAKSDGTQLVQLTDCDDLTLPTICTGGNCAFYASGGEIRKVDLLSLEEVVIARLPGIPLPRAMAYGAADHMGTMYYGVSRDAKDVCSVFGVEVATGKTTTLFEGRSQNHLHVEPGGRTLFFNEILPEGCYQPYVVNPDGSNLRKFPFRNFAHHTWLGDTGKMQGCLVPPGNGVVLFSEEDEDPMPVASGRYYWHSGASLDGKWIVADTNWPHEGIYMINVATGNATYVCDARSSCSHPQWTHPHPSFSSKLRYVLFNSDYTGIGQAYLAELTDEFLEQAEKDYISRNPVW